MASMQVAGLSTRGLMVNEGSPHEEAPQEVPRSCGSVTARAVASQNSIPPAAPQPDPSLPGIFDGLEDLLDPGNHDSSEYFLRVPLSARFVVF